MRNSLHHSGLAQTLPAAQEQVANGGSLVGSSRDLAAGARADELVSYDDGEGSTIREGTRQRRQSEKEKAINSRLQTHPAELGVGRGGGGHRNCQD